MYCSVNNKPYVYTATCIREAYMLYICLIYQPIISTFKLGRNAYQEVNDRESVLPLPSCFVSNKTIYTSAKAII